MHETPNSLKGLAMLNIAISLWEMLDVKTKVGKLFMLFWSSPPENDKMLEIWCGLSKEVFQRLKRDMFPDILYRELFYISKKIGIQIYNWYCYIEHVNRYENRLQVGKVGDALKYCEKIYWTQQGTVDEVRILKSFWIGNANLNVSTVYILACRYALEECINSLWAQIPQDIQDKYDYKDIDMNNDDSQHILAYWHFSRNGEMTQLIEHYERCLNDFHFDYMYNFEHSIELNMCGLSMHKGYSEAFKYFWNKLNDEERDRNIVRGARSLILANRGYDRNYYLRERYSEIFVFLMSKMTAHHQKELFIGLGIARKIVSILLPTWAGQECILPILDKMWPYIENDAEIVCEILQEITRKMILDYEMDDTIKPREYRIILQQIWKIIPVLDYEMDYGIIHNEYRSLLHQAWKRIPIEMKRKIAQLPLCHLIFMGDLFNMLDVPSIELVFSTPEMASRKMEFLKCGSERYVSMISKDQYERLDQFIDKIFVSEEEKKMFKEGIDLYGNFILFGEYHLADKFLNWQSSSHEDKVFFKSKIDNLHYLSVFILGGQYEKATEFLCWRFSTEEERKHHYKRTMLESEFVHEHIYELWLGQKDISAALEDCNKFLHWLLESEEEIKSFKQDFLSNEELETTLSGFDLRIRKDLIDVIEDILNWCMVPKEGIVTLKYKVVHNLMFKKCEECIARGFLEDAEQSVRSAFDEGAKRIDFIREFIMSDRGAASCDHFLQLWTRLQEERLDLYTKFIDFWIKPLGHLEEFERKLRFHRPNYDHAFINDNYMVFDHLLDNLKQSLDVPEVRNVA